jgi:uncharacterized damage-inducible protein DinB
MFDVSQVPRTDPPRVGGERELLESWLDFHRATLLTKCAGLTDAQLSQRSAPPSTLSLLGLVRHMTEVESGWFADFVGQRRQHYSSPENRDGDFDDLDGADVAGNVAAFEQECAMSRTTAAEHALEETYTDERQRTFSLRWIYLHMIEEYARHNGHADLLRERIDGVVGD